MQVLICIQCQGLRGACEAAVGAMEEKYEAGKTILILDAEGAFNALSRSSTLKLYPGTIAPPGVCSNTKRQYAYLAQSRGDGVTAVEAGVGVEARLQVEVPVVDSERDRDGAPAIRGRRRGYRNWQRLAGRGLPRRERRTSPRRPRGNS